MEGVEISRKARDFFRNDWTGQAFMAVGQQDPVLGGPVMERLKADIRGSSDLMVIPDGGHFLQEWGEPIAKAALEYFDS